MAASSLESLKINNIFSVKGPVLVTGGGRGIGLMIAAGFVANGCKVYISSRTKEVCDQVAAHLTKKGPGVCISLPADLSKPEECRALGKKIQELEPEHGLHILINNSGTNWGEAIETFPSEAFDKVFDLNVKSYFVLTQALLPSLCKAASKEDPSRVINVGSINGLNIPTLPTFSYSASKAAVHHMTRVLAAHLAAKNITVNAIAPGPFESKMMTATLKAHSNEIIESVPLKRIGQAQDMAGVCLYLSSQAGAYVTGVVLPVDGGCLVNFSSKI